MTDEIVRLNRKNEIVIPKEARQKLGLSSGDQLVVRVEKNVLIMKPKPRSYAKYMQGLHKDVWRSTDASAYIERERRAWSNQERASEPSLKGSKP